MIMMIMMILKGGSMEGTDDLRETMEGGEGEEEEEGDYQDEEEYEEDQQDKTQVNKLLFQNLTI